jgi:hypothetical protein
LTEIIKPPAPGQQIIPIVVSPVPSVSVNITPSAAIAGVPSILTQLGFTAIQQTMRRLIITNEGPPASGKTAFIRTMPGPLAVLDFDKGTEGVLDLDIYGNPIVRKSLDAPDFDETGSKTMTPNEWATAKASYDLFKKLMREIIRSGQVRSLAVDNGGMAYALAQAARFGRIAQVGEVPAQQWTSMQYEFENIFLEAADYGINLLVTHRQGSKFKGMVGEKELKGYKAMQFLGQVHLVHQKRVVRVPEPTAENPARMVEQIELSVKVAKCRPNVMLEGVELPVVLLGPDQRGMMQSIGARFVDVAMRAYPSTKESDWI